MGGVGQSRADGGRNCVEIRQSPHNDCNFQRCKYSHAQPAQCPPQQATTHAKSGSKTFVLRLRLHPSPGIRIHTPAAARTPARAAAYTLTHTPTTKRQGAEFLNNFVAPFQGLVLSQLCSPSTSTALALPGAQARVSPLPRSSFSSPLVSVCRTQISSTGPSSHLPSPSPPSPIASPCRPPSLMDSVSMCV